VIEILQIFEQLNHGENVYRYVSKILVGVLYKKIVLQLTIRSRYRVWKIDVIM